jgi:hypothetical protein
MPHYSIDNIWLTHLQPKVRPVNPMASTQLSPKITAPYVPFKSFLTSLDYLRQGLPHILDRSAWPTFSGGLAGQMLATFRFLGLIEDEYYETTQLLERAIDPDKRKDALREAVHKGYAQLIDLDLSRATPKQLADLLSELYNVTGATHKKAMTFFLHAAKYIELPLSPPITRKTRSSSPRRRRSNNSGEILLPAPPRDNADSPPPIDPARQAGSSKTIALHGGGKATVSFDVDVWSMTTEDQEFVFGLIRTMNEYEKRSPQQNQTT